MSVIQRDELESSPLADLHAIASELGLEGYRALRKEDLIGAILKAHGADDGGEAEAEKETKPKSRSRSRSKKKDDGDDAKEKPKSSRSRSKAKDADEAKEEEPKVDSDEEPEQTVTGVLDILPNGSGFLRVDAAGQTKEDPYVSPAQIRRCELRAGDEVVGPVRPPRRNERHPSLVRVEAVNGGDPEPTDGRKSFDDLTPVFATERLKAPKELKEVPYGKGSRVAVGGPPGAGATTLLRELATELAKSEKDVDLAVVLVGARPEEVTEWKRAVEVPVVGGSFDTSIEAQVQAADLAVEKAKRKVESGSDAALVVDSLEALPPAAQRRVFGAARKLEEGGSLTIFASTGMAWEAQRFATTRVMLEPAGPDTPGPRVAAARSGTLHADQLK